MCKENAKNTYNIKIAFKYESDHWCTQDLPYKNVLDANPMTK